MDHGDSRVIMHESFKDLKTRRAEQEAYRRALDEQIMQKKAMQEQERMRYSGKKSGVGLPNYFHDAPTTTGLPNLPPVPQAPHIQKSPELLATNFGLLSPRNLPPPPPGHGDSLCPPPREMYKLNDIDSYDEPHPAAIIACMEQFQNSMQPCHNQQQQYGTPPHYDHGQVLPPIVSQNQVQNAWTESQMFSMNTPIRGGPGPMLTPQSSPANPACNSTMMEDIVRRPRSGRIASPVPAQIPEITPECMKYIQQVMPGFTYPTPVKGDSARNTQLRASMNSESNESIPAFSSGTSTESSSVEDVTHSMKKVHVSQTSEELAGVKISRKQYKVELQKQIDERKRREEELRQKEEAEEERIQQKIRLDQEKMQKEYEEELRKQQEKEAEAEKKRLAALRNQCDILKTEDERKAQTKVERRKVEKYEPGPGACAYQTSSSESIESVGEFFDTTMSKDAKFINPDDRVIPVVARMLKQKSLEKAEGAAPESAETYQEVNDNRNTGEENVNPGDSGSLTARVDRPFPDSQFSGFPDPNLLPGPPITGVVREMAIRSAPAPSTNSNDVDFLKTLTNYLQGEKTKLDQHVGARGSKSAENF